MKTFNLHLLTESCSSCHPVEATTTYADLREGLDPELRLEDRAFYLRKVVLRRTLLEQHLKPRGVIVNM